MPKRKVVLVIEITVSFEEYPTKALNTRAENQIRKWITDSIKDTNHLPLYVERDGTSYVEDETGPSTFTIRRKYESRIL